ncbi:hypothetical protein ABEB36_013613 [Hypothenemus hampei]|uniref:THAP-type domain-containing protein n=1 Tax=Hypothenemus hampei TaxID=57062 RepID=A0ABD1E991_HYPHA
MPTTCAIKGCKSRNKADVNISFFRFPLKDKIRMQHWVCAVGKKNWTPTISSRICSLHFPDNFFIINLGYKRTQLKSDAVPLLNCVYNPFQSETIQKDTAENEILSDAVLLQACVPNEEENKVEIINDNSRKRKIEFSNKELEGKRLKTTEQSQEIYQNNDNEKFSENIKERETS